MPWGTRAANLCSTLGIERPIIQAPMAGGWTTPSLVASVSNAGGLGMLPAALLTTEQLRSAIEAVSALTRRPFGINFLLAPPEPAGTGGELIYEILDTIRGDLGLGPAPREVDLGPPQLQDQLSLAIGSNIPIVSFAMGDPTPYLPALVASGIITMATATTPDEATRLERAGVHVIVAQGAEAGGHRSTFEVSRDRSLPLIGTMVLVPSVVGSVLAPVVASGGIMDGKGIAAALCLGASGVQMGTRFLLSRESAAFPAYKRRCVEAGPADTAVTDLLTGRPARAVVNEYLRRLMSAGMDPLPWPYQAAAASEIFARGLAEDSADWAPVLCGQGASLGTVDQGAAEIVEQLVRETGRVLEELTVARA